MALRILLLIRAAITFAASVVLVIAPDVVPGTVGVRLSDGGFLLSYLLAGAELSIAYLSLAGFRSRQADGVRFIVTAIVVFHAATALLEVLALSKGIDGMLWGNVAVRVVVVALFTYYGLVRKPSECQTGVSP